MIRFNPLWIVILLAVSMTVQGATVNVDVQGQGYRSIQEAIDAAGPGDIIVVASGIYPGSLDVDKTVILRGVDSGAGRPVVDGEGNGSAVTIMADGVVLEGFSICNAVGGQESGIRVLSSNNLIRQNLVFNNGQSGISVLSAGNNTIAENVVHGNGAGIALSFADGNLISGNQLYDNREEGVRLVSSAGNVLAQNNATRNGRAGIALSSSDENVLKGNWAWENGAGIFLEGSAGCVLSLNRLFDNREHDAYDTGINQWDDGVQGNLYGDFSCVDSDGDGICDSGYRIPGGFSIDNLPLADGSRSLPRSVQPGTSGALPVLPPYSPSVDLLPPSSGPSPAGTGAPVMVEVLPGSGPWPWTSPMPALEEPIPSPGGEATSPSALNLIDHAMVRAIRPSGDPEGRTSTFSAGDPRAYSWVQFGPVYEAHDLLWRWYYPDGSLYGESRGRIPEPGSRGLEHWFSPKYWSELEIQGGLAGRHPGEWRVEFYVDGEMMVAERFSIV